MNIDIERLKREESLWPDESVGCWVVTDDSGNFVKHLFVHDPRDTATMDENQRAKYIPRPEPATEWDGGLPEVGTANYNSSLSIRCIHPRPKVWGVAAHRDGNAIVYVPACKSNGTDQGEAYLLSASDFTDEKAERDRDDLISIIIEDTIHEINPSRLADAIITAGWQKPD